MFAALNIDPKVLKTLYRLTVGKKYRLGAKPKPGAHPTQWKYTDCSGYVRWLVAQATNQEVILPLGSVLQYDWFRRRGYLQVPYSDCIRRDNAIRIAFIKPRPGSYGHVWLVLNGSTIESYAGVGVGSRAWNTPPLDKADSCFILTPPKR
jgi:cell wall-associated NlpC family hydrolase